MRSPEEGSGIFFGGGRRLCREERVMEVKNGFEEM